MYLKNWAKGNKISTYCLLVPNANVPVWKDQSLKYSASIDNFYVRQENGREMDDFENEFMQKYETPAKEPLIKACNEQQLTMEDWDVLIDYIASQIVRTPAFYFKHQERIKRILPGVIEDVCAEIRELTPEKIKRQLENNLDRRKLFPVSLDYTGIKADNDHEYVGINVVAGKSIWLGTIEHLLSEVSPILHRHRWSIVSVAEGIKWPTSDDPVICLNYYQEGDYDFNGGWGRQGGEIIFPISPSKAIYTQIGVKHSHRIQFNAEKSRLIKKMIVEHALMYVFSCERDEEISILRPRVIDLKEYERIKNEIEEWYKKYEDEEVPYLDFK